MDHIVEIYKKQKEQTAISKPLLKWAGGKSRLLSVLTPRFLNLDMFSSGSSYIEPFLGGGSVAFSLSYPRMILSDKNIKLMNFYTQVKQRPEKLHRKICKYCDEFSLCRGLKEMENFYYETRKRYNDLVLLKGNGLTHASLFWFLNKTGFNGMYRETRSGDFNIPFGKRYCPRPDMDDFMVVSSILQKCSLYHKPFITICDMAKSGDVIYLDPPYLPISKTSSFSSYLRYGFGIDEHKNLCKIMNNLSQRGVVVVMSNSDGPLTTEIYASLKGFTFHKFSAQRFISGKASGRGKITELIISNQ